MRMSIAEIYCHLEGIPSLSFFRLLFRFISVGILWSSHEELNSSDRRSLFSKKTTFRQRSSKPFELFWVNTKLSYWRNFTSLGSRKGEKLETIAKKKAEKVGGQIINLLELRALESLNLNAPSALILIKRIIKIEYLPRRKKRRCGVCLTRHAAVHWLATRFHDLSKRAAKKKTWKRRSEKSFFIIILISPPIQWSWVEKHHQSRFLTVPSTRTLSVFV